MKFVRKWFPWFFSKSQRKELELYDSIKNLTLFLWWEIHETGDLKHLIKNEDYELTNADVERIEDTWDDIQDEHVDRFGLPHEYEDYLRQLKKVTLKRINFALSESGVDKTWLKIEERELEDMMKTTKTNAYKIKSQVEAAAGVSYVSPHIMVVIEYYSLVQVAQEKAEHGGNQ
jgi:hypothetical protein